MTERDEAAAQKALERLRTADNPGDPEAAHSDADDALCDLLIALGYEDVVKAWHRIEKWYA